MSYRGKTHRRVLSRISSKLVREWQRYHRVFLSPIGRLPLCHSPCPREYCDAEGPVIVLAYLRGYTAGRPNKNSTASQVGNQP